jgi:para-aminobenzoate synthetase/4-amino-4-deoxychorismate lyase
MLTSDRLIIHDARLQQWLCFQQPEQIIEAYRLEEVVPRLQQLETTIRRLHLYGAGFIAYEAATAFDSALKTHKPSALPLLWFGLYQKPEIIQLPAPAATGDYLLDWQPTVTREEYERAIASIKQRIAQGETYQVNYTTRLQAPFRGDPWQLFLKLVRSQQADYGAYFESDRFAICSASPELFFRLEGDVASARQRLRLTSRPMKGTAGRGLALADDEAIARQLQNCPKNRAENVMIVDMIRNDMGRVADIGSVGVPSLFDVERYPTLWQMTSTVTASTGASLSEIMAALFPCASITGAPKARTMEIIRDLEATPRGIYTGSMGFVSPQGEAQFNVAIRTVLIDKESDRAEYGVGGGIVWDSVSADEYGECQVKARVLTANRPEFSLLETMLWQPGEGYFLLSYHLQRLRDSAIYFGYRLNLEEVKQKLEGLAKSLPPVSHKVRLLVAADGGATVEASRFSAACEPVKLSLSPVPVDPSNPFLYHKTTNREVYEKARNACPNCDDVVLWNQRGEVTETCIGNLVVLFGGELLTPPVKCGLLPGTFRAYLLETGKVREEAIALETLKRCEKIYVINSVRQWREGRL